MIYWQVTALTGEVDSLRLPSSGFLLLHCGASNVQTWSHCYCTCQLEVATERPCFELSKTKANWVFMK